MSKETNNIISLYTSHDASATFIDKNGKLRILELERFANIRYAMFSSKFDNWSLGVNDNIRREFLSHIKSEFGRTPDLIVYTEGNIHDLNLFKEYFPNSKYEIWNAHHVAHAYSSYFLSPFDDAWIFSIDGGGADYGEYTTTKIFKAKSIWGKIIA
jgi:predicted NodU family carbamoyl transferase